jgi:hypothetical protein
MPHTALYLDINAEPEVDSAAKTWTDHEADRFLRQCCLGERLSNGTFGTAFRMVRDEADIHDDLASEWVIKLPNALLSQTLRTKKRPRDVFIDDALDMNAAAGLRNEAVAYFRAEFHNAEAILEPPLFHHLNPNGGRIRAMNERDWLRLIERRNYWRSLEGYEHLHPVLHFDADLPALISERADGTLADWRCEVAAQPLLELRPSGRPPVEWQAIARQIASAVAFILACTPKAHVDIKPENVFYIRGGGRVPLLQLGDYGLCKPKDDAVGRDLWNGTRPYNPEQIPGKVARLTYGAQSIFQLAATLFSVLRVPYDVGRTRWGFPGMDGRLVCHFAIDEAHHILLPPQPDSALYTVIDMLYVDPFQVGADGALKGLFEVLKQRLVVDTPVYQ